MLPIKAVPGVRAFLEVGAQRIPLEQDVSVLGRENGRCDIVLPGPHLSPRHAFIVRSDDTFTLFDFRSQEGTWLNAQPVRQGCRLQSGDLIRLGEQSVRFHVEPVVAAGPPPTQPPPSDRVRVDRADPGWTACSVALRQVIAARDPDDWARTVVDSGVELTGACGGLLLRVSRGELKPWIHHRLSAPWQNRSGSCSEAIAQLTLAAAEPQLIDSVETDPRLIAAVTGPTGWVFAENIDSALSIPIRLRGEIAGLLQLHRRRDEAPFTARDLELLVAFGEIAGAALLRVS
jgi:GAF domain-containing protein